MQRVTTTTVAEGTRFREGVAVMRLYRILLTPWVATPPSVRWLFAFVLLLVALGAVLSAIYGVAGHAWPISAVMFGIGNAACWLLVLPNGLVLALAARRLRLPGISRDVVWSLPLYAALGIGLPVLCQFPQGHALSFAIAQLLIAVGALLFMLLPYYLGLTSYFLFVLSHRAVSHFISIPGPSGPRFVPWGGALALVLGLMLAWRWHQLLRGDYAERGMRAPGLMYFRRSLTQAQSDPLTGSPSVRVTPDWMIARPDLHGVGPQAAAKSLRIALGGVYLPQTIIGRLYQWAPAFLIVLLLALLFFGFTLGEHGFSRAMHYVFSREGFVALSWMFAMFCLMVVVMPAELLTLRWGRPNAELPVLALLPGLGGPDGSKQVLLRAALVRPASQLVLLLLIGWFGAASVAAGWPVALAMLMVALSCVGYLYAMALSIFGGRALSSLGKSLLTIGMLVLLSLTVLLPQLWQGWDGLDACSAKAALVAAWLALALLLLWLGRRGCRALRERAHPFMPN